MNSSVFPASGSARAGVLLIALLAVLSAAGVATATEGRTNDPPSRDSQTAAALDAAVSAVRSLAVSPQAGVGVNALVVPDVQTGDLAASGPTDGAYFRYYTVSGQDVFATVDVRDSHVAQLLLLHRAPTSRPTTTITPQQASSVASAYLAARNISTIGLTMTLSLQDHGDSETYVVAWQRIVNGAEVPDSREVEMDAGTGIVFRLHNITRPYAVPSPAVVGRDLAISNAGVAVAQTTSAAPTSAVLVARAFTVVSSDLRVVFAAAGVQQLIWQIGLKSTSDYFLVNVDAATGNATVIGRG